MKLQEILNYRQECFIHKLPMQICTPTKLRGSKLKHCCAILGPSPFDENKLLILNKKEITVQLPFLKDCSDPLLEECTKAQGLMRCPECHKDNSYSFYPTFQHTLGAVNINNIYHQEHSYIFGINTSIKDNFDFLLLEENIQYNLDNKIYRMSTNLLTKEVVFRLGDCDKSMTVGKVSSSLRTMQSDDFDPYSIGSLDQLLQKIKLYNLYS